jgi:hypothetical protein
MPDLSHEQPQSNGMGRASEVTQATGMPRMSKARICSPEACIGAMVVLEEQKVSKVQYSRLCGIFDVAAIVMGEFAAMRVSHACGAAMTVLFLTHFLFRFEPVAQVVAIATASM